MTSTPTPIVPKDSTPLLEKSDLVSQTSHSPLPSEVASDLLREKLATRYPALNIAPDKTLVATPQWRVVDDHVEMESVEFLSLTHTLVLQSLYGTTANYLEGEHFLTLESDDGWTRDFDAYVVGDLELDRLFAHARDRSKDPAGGDDLVTDLESALEFLHLLLPLPHRQNHDEVEDPQNQNERNELQPRTGVATLRRGSQRDQKGINKCHES